MREKPEYTKARKHLDDPSNLEHWPVTPREIAAVEVLKSQRRYSKWKKRDAERQRDRMKKEE